MGQETSLRSVLRKLSAVEAAARLLGCDIIRLVGGKKVIGRIVETEAYDQSDPSSHSFRGVTKRNAVMFGPAGMTYVYFTYGMHYCMNVVVGKENEGSAVLIRALQPLEGLNLMFNNRKVDKTENLTNGPAKLTQALGIDLKLNAHDLSTPPLTIKLNPPIKDSQIQWSSRIGIREKKDEIKLWRAGIKDNKYISKPL